MTITATSSFSVADSALVSATAAVILQPPAGFGTGGRGRLVHPTLAGGGAFTCDYENTPDEVMNLDGDIIYRPEWLHGKTLSSGADTFWVGNPRDVVVIERWTQGEVGAPLAIPRTLQTLLQNPVDPATGQWLLWSPNYATPLTWRVAIADLRVGGQSYTLGGRLKSYGYAPLPVELELRVLGVPD